VRFAGLAALLALFAAPPSAAESGKDVSPPVSTAPKSSSDLQSCEQEFQRVVTVVRPSVVAVIAYSRADGVSPAGDGIADLKMSVGSGVILNSQGHVLTTQSVVGASRNLFVRTHDGNERPAVFLGSDHASELVLLKVSGDGLEPAHLGQPGALRPGAWAIIVAESFGKYPHYAFGSFTAVETGDTTTSGAGLLQMSAQVYPGNTGGAVANSNGEVVGVVLGAVSPGSNSTSAAAPAGVGQNLSIAIPIDRAEQVASDLAKHGSVASGYLGVSVRTPAAALKDLLQFKDGVLILDVMPGSPAEAAGIEAGDVILQFSGMSVRDQVEFARLVASNRPGTRCPVELLRGDVRLTRDVVLSIAPATVAKGRRTDEDRRQIESRIQSLRAELDELEVRLKQQPTSQPAP
jgi:serine protease Do